MGGVKRYVGALFFAIGLMAIATLVVLNLTFVYRWIVYRYDLEAVTGLPLERLMYNYRLLILYSQLPWIRELYLPDFAMSRTGVQHFHEVKVIFHVLQVFAIAFISYLVFNRVKKYDLFFLLNRSANLIFVLFGTLFLGMILMFDQFFIWFHLLLFNNDYWRFNAVTDPVILALPEQLFMTKGMLIAGLLLTFAGVIKIIQMARLKPR